MAKIINANTNTNANANANSNTTSNNYYHMSFTNKNEGMAVVLNGPTLEVPRKCRVAVQHFLIHLIIMMTKMTTTTTIIMKTTMTITTTTTTTNHDNNPNLHPPRFLKSLFLFGNLPLLLVSLCPDPKQNEEDDDLLNLYFWSKC